MHRQVFLITALAQQIAQAEVSNHPSGDKRDQFQLVPNKHGMFVRKHAADAGKATNQMGQTNRKMVHR